MPYKMRGTGLIIFLGVILTLPVMESGAQPLTFEKLKVSGLNLIYQHEPGAKITSLFFCFPGGQRLEPTHKSGLAYLTTRLMLEIPEEDKISQLEEGGFTLKSGAYPDFSFIQLDCLNSNLEIGLKIVSDNINKPLFSGPRIEALKKIMASEERKEKSRLISSARMLLIRKIWPGHPSGNSIYGGESSLKNISKKDISSFYSYIMDPECSFLAVISGLNKDEITGLLNKYFVIKQKKEKPPQAWKEGVNPARPGTDIEYTGPSGAVTMVGFVLKGEPESIYLPAFILEKIIGEGPGSAIWNLRQEKTYAYNVNSQLEIIDQKVLLFAYLETDPELSEMALSDLLNIFKDIASKGISLQEIEKGRLLARQAFLRESFYRDSRFYLLANFLANNLPLEYFNSFLSGLLSVSPESINSLIQSSLQPEQAVSVVVSKN